MSRLRRILFFVIPIISIPAIFVYDVIRAAVDLDVPSMVYVREGLIVLSFSSIYFLIEDRRTRNRGIATKEIGRLLMVSIAALVMTGTVSFFQLASQTNQEVPHFRQSSLALFLSTFVGVILGIFAIYTLQTVKDLTMFKRRKGTRRNYAFYLVSMLCACAGGVPFISTEAGIVATIFFPLSILAGILNSFKQNWIVYLSRREKIYSIIYSALLFLALLFLNLLLVQNSAGSKALEAFSRPLRTFVQINAIVGAIYFGMSFVSTLFHLPTAEVFERKQSELNSLHNLGRLVTQVFDFNDLVNTVTQMTTEVCGAKSAWLELLQSDEKTGLLNVNVVSQRNISREEIDTLAAQDNNSFRRLMLDSRKVVLIDDLWNDRRTKHVKERGSLKGSLLSVPLVAHAELIGVLHATKDFANGFDQDDIDVMTTFADHVTIALENSKLIAKSIERERLQQELEVARKMQLRLLPQRMPQIPFVDVAAVSVSSLEVGGDYYDFVSLRDGHLGIVVGDVSGKGVSAAFYMAEVKGIFLSLSKICTSPRDLLVRANQSLVESLEKNAFISLLYAILDGKNGRLTLARAGHCPLVHVSGTRCELVRPTGLGLGLTDGKIFEESTEERTIDLHKDDVCLFYTDGVTESRNSQGDEYGYERLVDAALRTRNFSADEIKNRILEDVRTFTGNRTYNDDMTLVVIKWNGSSRGKV